MITNLNRPVVSGDMFRLVESDFPIIVMALSYFTGNSVVASSAGPLCPVWLSNQRPNTPNTYGFKRSTDRTFDDWSDDISSDLEYIGNINEFLMGCIEEGVL